MKNLVLILGGLLTFGNYYCGYDIPGALNLILKSHLDSPYQEYQTMLNLMYSIYALPNIILPFIGGILIDTLDPNMMILVFSIITCCGQALFSFGVSTKSISIIYLGRLLFGLGAESLDVGQTDVTTRYFHGKGLSFALGINLSIARIATALNDNLSPFLALKFGVSTSVWFGLLVCIASFVAGIFLIWLSKNNQHYVIVDSDETESDVVVNSTSTGNENTFNTLQDDFSSVTDSLLERQEDYYDQVDESIHWTLAIQFPTEFWYLFFLIVTLYGSIVPFFHICTDFFQTKSRLEPEMAALMMSLPDWISAIGSPISGYLVDKYGNRANILVISTVLILISHLLLTFTNLHPAFAMSIIGLSYSIFGSALWPCVPLVVGGDQIATAYGLATTGLNLSLFIFPLIVAMIRQKEGYLNTQLFFIFLCCFAIFFAVLIRLNDEKLNEKPNVTEDAESTPKFVGDGIAVSSPWTIVHRRRSIAASLPERRLSQDSISSGTSFRSHDGLLQGT